jgi:hypothetical protein
LIMYIIADVNYDLVDSDDDTSDSDWVSIRRAMSL